MSPSRKMQVGNYRFLHNKKTTEEKLIEEITSRCGKLLAGKIVLSIQDTTEANLSAHSGRINTKETEKEKCGLGDIDDNKNGIGYKIHPSLVVDTSNCFPIGFQTYAFGTEKRIWLINTSGNITSCPLKKKSLTNG